jgi:hypothetical protein
MDDLALVGVHDDGEHLLVVGPGGQKFRLRVDDALRAAVRRDRARLSQLQLQSDGRLRPREIQARIRAGETAEEVAASAGIDLVHVQRYEGPVLAEREYVAEQARAVSMRRGVSGDSLGEVVAERLGRRDIDADNATWDAWRTEDGTWTVALDFDAGTRRRQARWTFSPAVRHVTPLDDEARWLTEDEPPAAPTPPGQRRLAPVREREPQREHVFDVEASGSVSRVPEPAAGELLDTLRERRGRRGRPIGDDDEEPGTPDPVREAIDSLLSRAEAMGEPPAAHPARSRPQDARDGEVLVLPDPEASALEEHLDVEDDADEPDDEIHEPAARAARANPRKQRRASVPSWDDIVFGQRRD